MTDDNKYVMTPEEEEDWKHLKWQCFLDGVKVSLVMLIGAGVLFGGLHFWEQSEASTAMPWPLALIYLLGGKWLVLYLVAGIGALIFCYALYQYLFADVV